MKKTLKHLASFAVLALLIMPIFASPALAQSNPSDPYGIDYVGQGLGDTAGERDQDPRELIGRFINFALGFLGLIAVGIILIGGFKWMTSGGNEEKTGDAKKLIVAGVVGLIIVLSAWGLSTWLISSLAEVVG